VFELVGEVEISFSLLLRGLRIAGMVLPFGFRFLVLSTASLTGLYASVKRHRIANTLSSKKKMSIGRDLVSLDLMCKVTAKDAVV